MTFSIILVTIIENLNVKLYQTDIRGIFEIVRSLSPTISYRIIYSPSEPYFYGRRR